MVNIGFPGPGLAPAGRAYGRITDKADWHLSAGADPKHKTKSYDRFTFDMFPIKNGKIVEH